MATAREIELAALAYLSYDLTNKNRFTLPGWTRHAGLSRTDLSSGFAATVSSNVSLNQPSIALDAVTNLERHFGRTPWISDQGMQITNYNER